MSSIKTPKYSTNKISFNQLIYKSLEYRLHSLKQGLSKMYNLKNCRVKLKHHIKSRLLGRRCKEII